MWLFKKFVSQTRKPEGFLGKMMVNWMNGGHAKMADWWMSYLESKDPKEIIEIGCGWWRNAWALLKKYPESKVTAIDYSEVSVKKAASYNKKEIESWRCVVQHWDVSNLEFSEEKFELATAFETIYFWPWLEDCFKQVAKVLKPGSEFLIVNECDWVDKEWLKFEKIIDWMKCYTVEQIEEVLKNAWFSEVKSYRYDNKPWITVIAKK